MAENLTLDLTGSKKIEKSYTEKLAEKDAVTLTIQHDVAGQVAYAPKGNDIVVTVYGVKTDEAYTYSRVKTTYAVKEAATTSSPAKYSVTTVTENLVNGEWVAAKDSKTVDYKGESAPDTEHPSYAYTKTTTYLTTSSASYTPSADDKFVSDNSTTDKAATETYTYSRVKTTYAETSAAGASTKTYSVTTVTENLTNGEWVAAKDSKTEAYTPKEGETVNTKDPSYAYTKTTQLLPSSASYTGDTYPSYKLDGATVDTDTVLSTVTYKNGNLVGDAGYVKLDAENLDVTNLLTVDYEIKNDGKGNFNGTWMNEFSTSTTDVDKFNLGTGNDEITFAGNYGNDTVTANKDEKLNLVFTDTKTEPTSVTPKYAIDGNDVVLSSQKEYYATIKVDKNTMFDGHLANLGTDGTWKSTNPQVYANGVVDISDAFIDATYVLSADKTKTIDKAAYDKLSKSEQAKYDFVDGTLKLTIQTGAAHLSNDSFAKYRLTTDSLYTLEDSWKSTGDYAALTGEAREASTSDVKFLFGATDLEKIDTTEGGYRYAFYTEEQYNGLDAAQKHTVSDLHIYEVVNGKPIEITDEYIDAAKAAADLTAYNKGLYDSQYDGSVTLTNYAKADNGSVVTVGSEKLADHNYDVAMAKDQTSYKGSWLNENIVAGTDAESFAMGSGKDSITIDIKTDKDSKPIAFGNKTVTLSEKEDLTINISRKGAFDQNNYKTSVKGNDLVVSVYDKDWHKDNEALGSITIKNWAKSDSSVAGLKIVATDTTSETTVAYPMTFDLLDEEVKYYNGTEYVTAPNPTVWYASDVNIDKTATSLTTSRLSDKIDLTGTKVTKVNSGAGNDTVVSNELNNKLNLGTGSNKIEFGATFGNDEVTVNNGETLDLDFATGATLAFSTNGKDLIVSADTKGENTVTVKNFVGKATGAKLTIDGTDIYDVAAFKALTTYKADDAVKGKIKGSALNDDIDASDYISANGVKGLTINSGSGYDKVVGTDYNDTVKASSLATQTARVAEESGTNKVTFGKGNDIFIAGEANATFDGAKDGVTTYSSNTVNMGSGNNKAFLASDGVNKLTVGNGANEVTVSAGYNTIKAGNGGNTIKLSDGINKVTTGKGKETFTISGGNNTINAGAGEVVANITNAGYNVITAKNGKNQAGTFNLGGTGYTKVTSGAGTDTYTINANGTNVINSGAGADTYNIDNGTNIITAKSGKKEVDTFTISGGENVIASGAGADVFTITGGTNVINGGAGNDTYNIDNDVFGKLAIADTKGANNFVFETSTKDFFFDVTLSKKGTKYSITEGTKTYSGRYSVGNDIFFADNVTLGLSNGVDVEGRKAIADVQVGDNHYSLNQTYIDTVAANVAGWLNKNEYASTDAVFAAEKKDGDIEALLALYANTGDVASSASAAGGYIAKA